MEERTYKNRVLVEYIGEFPGLRPHGNTISKHRAVVCQNFQRTPKHILQNIDEQVTISKCEPVV